MNTVDYKIPAENAYLNRQKFYSCQKQLNESIEVWYQRIESCVNGCDYGDLSTFMLIDKFVSGLSFTTYDRLKHLNIRTGEQVLAIAVSDDHSVIKDESTNEILFEEDVDDFIFVDDKNHVNADDVTSKAEIVLGQCDEYQFQIDGDIETKDILRDEEPSSNSDETRIKRDQISLPYEEKKPSKSRSCRLCNMCQKSFHSQERLRRHMTTHEHDGRTFVCYLCSYEFKLWNSLRGHYSAKHIARKLGRNCDLCSKSFFSQKTLDNHMKIHQGVDQGHQCSHCHKVFDTRKRLLLHERVHSDFKRFVCETCGHAVRTSKELELHRRKHSDARPYECNICGQSLKSLTNMKNHMRQHTGERPFQCELCSRTFVQRANYQKHMRVHRQDRPHPCSLCGKRFMTAYDLKVHINVHTGTKPFACTMCNQSFTQPGTLRHHKLRIHSSQINAT